MDARSIGHHSVWWFFYSWPFVCVSGGLGDDGSAWAVGWVRYLVFGRPPGPWLVYLESGGGSPSLQVTGFCCFERERERDSVNASLRSKSLH